MQVKENIFPKRAVAESRSAITVVSAFATGKGVTIGIDLPCRVTAEIIPRAEYYSKILVKSAVQDPHRLIERCVDNSLKALRVEANSDELILISVDSEIPSAAGLKSSSALSVAVVKAIFGLFSRSTVKSSEEILRISCRSSIQSGASLTGAFDDAAAGLLGGLVFSDNTKFRLLRHQSLNTEFGSRVKLFVPSYQKLTSSLKLSEYHEYKKLAQDALRFARKGIIVQAMLINSMIHSLIHRYSMQPIVSSIDEGASASGVSGKGPAVAAICPNSKIAARVEKRWKAENPNCRIVTAVITKANMR